MNKRTLLHFCFILIIYLVIIKPAYIVNINVPILKISVSYLFYFIQLILILLLGAIKIKNKKIKKMDVIIVFLVVSASLSNIENGYNILLALDNYINLFVTYLFFDYELKNNKYEFIRISAIIFVFLLIINYLSILLKPINYFNQNTRIHFLGYDNDVVPIIFTFLLFLTLNIYLKNGKNTFSYIGIGIAILTLLKTWSANGIVGLVILLIYLVFFRKNKTDKIINFKNIFILSIIVFVCLVVFRMQDKLEYIIVNVLNRDITFTGRTRIWDNALKTWKEHKLFGVGIFDFIQRSKIYGVYHAHCTYLNILFEVGIFGFLIRMFLFKEVNNILKRYHTIISSLIVCFFAIYFSITTIEVYVNDILFYALLGLSINLEKFNNEELIN